MTPTGRAFHNCDADVKCIMGPIGCLPCDTEVMTPGGWIRIADWSGQEILQWDAKDGTTRYAVPKRFVNAECPYGFLSYPFIGGGRMVVTGNHRVVYREQGVRQWSVCEAWELDFWSEGSHRIEIPGGENGGEALAVSTRWWPWQRRRVPAPDGRQYCFETDTGFFVVRQEDRIFVTGNSGKSSACSWELWFKACRQVPDPFDGVRRVKFMIVRNTFTELIDTTVRTWVEWFPETKIVKFPQLHGTLRFPHPVDGGPVEIELQFRALDNENQVKDLLSLEVTGCWFNECKELDWGLVFNAMSRRGRYPKANREAGYLPIQDMGVIMDTNPCSEESWYYRKAEIEKPDGWAFFRQPPGVLRIVDEATGRARYEANRGQDPSVPPAENCENYTDGFDYYTKKIAGADEDWIKVYLMGEYGTTMAGKVVYPEYSDAVHYHDGELTPAWGLPLFMGTDFGRTPATVIGQLMPDGQIVVYDELCGQDMGIIEFCQTALRPRLMTKYRMAQMKAYNFADPAGDTGNQIDNISCIEMMNQNGIPTAPCAVPNNSPYLRWTAVAECLRRRLSNGKGGLVICRPCKMLRAGFLGKYCYKKLSAAAAFGAEQYAATVDKGNPYSHPHDGLQYMVYGATHQGGEGAFDVGLRRRAAAEPDIFTADGFSEWRRRSAAERRAGGAYAKAPGGRYSRLNMAGYC